jgi:hypothetical protein
MSKRRNDDEQNAYIVQASFDYIDGLFAPSVFLFTALRGYAAIQGKPLNMFFNIVFCYASPYIAKQIVSVGKAEYHNKLGTLGDSVVAHSHKIRLITTLSEIYFLSHSAYVPALSHLVNRASEVYLNRGSIWNIGWILWGSEVGIRFPKADLQTFKVPFSDRHQTTDVRKVNCDTTNKQDLYTRQSRDLIGWHKYAPIFAIGCLEFISRLGIVKREDHILFSACTPILLGAASGFFYGKPMERSLESNSIKISILGWLCSTFGIVEQSFAKDIALVTASAKLGTLVRNVCNEGLTGNKVVAV